MGVVVLGGEYHGMHFLRLLAQLMVQKWEVFL
jgi:hypothetical protein